MGTDSPLIASPRHVTDDRVNARAREHAREFYTHEQHTHSNAGTHTHSCAFVARCADACRRADEVVETLSHSADIHEPRERESAHNTH